MQITIPFEEAIAQGFPEEMLNKQFPGFAAQYEEIQKLYREYINDLSEIEKLKKENYNLLKNPILNSEKKEELQALSQAIIEQKNNKTEKMSNNKNRPGVTSTRTAHISEEIPHFAKILYHLRSRRTTRTFVWLLFLYPILHIL